MSICWYCHWGWPKPIADIFFEAVKKLNGDESPLRFGPAHVVWEDENFNLAESCLENAKIGKYCDNMTEDERKIVMWSLEELIKLPLEELDSWPDNYDGENPQNYPPPDGWVEMVKIY